MTSHIRYPSPLSASPYGFAWSGAFRRAFFMAGELIMERKVAMDHADKLKQELDAFYKRHPHRGIFATAKQEQNIKPYHYEELGQ